MFRSLRQWNYRLFLIGVLVSNTGTWMQRVAQTWLVLQLTHGDGSALGITTGLQFLPILLFGLWGGMIADRYPKRALLTVTQSCMAVQAGVLALLDASGVVQVWHVYALAFVLGAASVFDNPARQSFVVELVGVADLPNAVGLNSATFNVTRMVGPAIGGLIVSGAGTSWAFAINAVSYAGLVLTIRVMREQELRTPVPVRREAGQLRGIWHYLLGRRDLLLIMILVGVINTFGQNFQITIALMVDSGFHAEATAYGWAFSALAIGSIGGAMLAAGRRRPRLRYLFLGTMGMAIGEVCAALAPTLGIFLISLVPIGLATLTVTTSANSIVQTSVEPLLRGRIMAVYLLMNAGGRPLGAPLAGWLGSTFGPRWCFASGGLIVVAASVVALRVLPGWRRVGQDGQHDGQVDAEATRPLVDEVVPDR